MRTFYSEYVQHCMRFYARHPNPKFRSDADKLNWNACKSALEGFTDDEQDILLTIYREADTIPENIHNISVARNMKQDSIWNLLNKLERRVAKRRGLI